jgi:hypothetical protein
VGQRIGVIQIECFQPQKTTPRPHKPLLSRINTLLGSNRVVEACRSIFIPEWASSGTSVQGRWACTRRIERASEWCARSATGTHAHAHSQGCRHRRARTCSRSNAERRPERPQAEGRAVVSCGAAPTATTAPSAPQPCVHMQPIKSLKGGLNGPELPDAQNLGAKGRAHLHAHTLPN